MHTHPSHTHTHTHTHTPQHHGVALIAAHVDVLEACVVSMDQEKDPRCLMTAFSMCRAAIDAAHTPLAVVEGCEVKQDGGGGAAAAAAAAHVHTQQGGGGGGGSGGNGGGGGGHEAHAHADAHNNAVEDVLHSPPKTAAEAAAAYLLTSAAPKRDDGGGGQHAGGQHAGGQRGLTIAQQFANASPQVGWGMWMGGDVYVVVTSHIMYTPHTSRTLLRHSSLIPHTLPTHSSHTPHPFATGTQHVAKQCRGADRCTRLLLPHSIYTPTQRPTWYHPGGAGRGPVGGDDGVPGAGPPCGAPCVGENRGWGGFQVWWCGGRSVAVFSLACVFSFPMCV